MFNEERSSEDDSDIEVVFNRDNSRVDGKSVFPYLARECSDSMLVDSCSKRGGEPCVHMPGG